MHKSRKSIDKQQMATAEEKIGGFDTLKKIVRQQMAPVEQESQSGNQDDWLQERIETCTEQPRKTAEIYDIIDIRDLTDEEWLKHSKEEILQLYKNCYKLLKECYAAQFQGRELREELIKFASWLNNSYNRAIVLNRDVVEYLKTH